MLRRALISLGLLVLALVACDQQRIFVQPSSDYEVIELIAQ